MQCVFNPQEYIVDWVTDNYMILLKLNIFRLLLPKSKTELKNRRINLKCLISMYLLKLIYIFRCHIPQRLDVKEV